MTVKKNPVRNIMNTLQRKNEYNLGIRKESPSSFVIAPYKKSYESSSRIDILTILKNNKSLKVLIKDNEGKCMLTCPAPTASSQAAVPVFVEMKEPEEENAFEVEVGKVGLQHTYAIKSCYNGQYLIRNRNSIVFSKTESASTDMKVWHMAPKCK